MSQVCVSAAPRRRTTPPDLDEVHPGREGFDAGGSLAPSPGLAPPPTRFRRPGEGGFPPTPALPPAPGFYQAPPLPHGPPARPVEDQGPTILQQDRGGESSPGTRSRSQRAREAARKADPDVTRVLQDADWRAHHLINVAGVQLVPDLIAAARRAGWRIDGPNNVAALPASPEAQQKLKAAGIDRPVHDSGHAKWNLDVRNRLLEIRTGLKSQRLQPGSEAYDRAAREELDRLQNDLRQEMLDRDRLTQSGSDGSPVPV